MFSIFSVARVGEPAATRPITGYSSCISALELELPIIDIPLDVPLSIDMKPFFSRALRCVSAELGDLKPSSLQTVSYTHLTLPTKA